MEHPDARELQVLRYAQDDTFHEGQAWLPTEYRGPVEWMMGWIALLAKERDSYV